MWHAVVSCVGALIFGIAVGMIYFASPRQGDRHRRAAAAPRQNVVREQRAWYAQGQAGHAYGRLHNDYDIADENSEDEEILEVSDDVELMQVYEEDDLERILIFDDDVTADTANIQNQEYYNPAYNPI